MLQTEQCDASRCVKVSLRADGSTIFSPRKLTFIFVTSLELLLVISILFKTDKRRKVYNFSLIFKKKEFTYV